MWIKSVTPALLQRVYHKYIEHSPWEYHDNLLPWGFIVYLIVCSKKFLKLFSTKIKLTMRPTIKEYIIYFSKQKWNQDVHSLGSENKNYYSFFIRTSLPQVHWIQSMRISR